MIAQKFMEAILEGHKRYLKKKNYLQQMQNNTKVTQK